MWNFEGRFLVAIFQIPQLQPTLLAILPTFKTVLALILELIVERTSLLPTGIGGSLIWVRGQKPTYLPKLLLLEKKSD